MYDIIVKIYWGVYFVQKADLDPLIFVPARECAKARFFIKNKDSWYYMKTGMLRR